jgi:pSer/pThr/pTyr-binding forkhead associated (FHA) protein
MDMDRLTVRDFNSKNGTFLNGLRISESLVKPGDLLKIGTLSFGIQIDGLPEDIESMRPADIPAKVQPSERKIIRADDSFEKMVSEFSDFDLNQTLGESSMGMNF